MINIIEIPIVIIRINLFTLNVIETLFLLTEITNMDKKINLTRVEESSLKLNVLNNEKLSNKSVVRIQQITKDNNTKFMPVMVR